MDKRYTRKQLKQPDEFITLSMRVWEYVQSHVPYALLSLGVAALIIAAVWTWSYFSEERATKSTAMLISALEIYAQPISAEEEAAPKKGDPKSDDGVPRFKTPASKLAAAEKELSKVVEKGGKLASVALAMRAGVRYDAGKLEEAISDYEAHLKGSSIPEFRLRAYEDLGYSYEALKKYDKALENFRRLAETAENRPQLAHYHEARILAKQGKTDGARELLRQVMDKSESLSLKNRAANQLLALEGQ